MKSFLRVFVAIIIVVLGFKVARAQMDLSLSAKNAVVGTALEQALYRLMPLPAGQILARRVPAESRAELDSLVRQSASNVELYAIRAQEDERQLDFKAAERDWRLAAQVSKNKQATFISLADFYGRRLQPQQEVQALLQAANLPASPAERYKADAEQSSWLSIHRALDVSSADKLPAETRAAIYETWIKRYPKQTEPLHQYFEALLAAKNLPEAHSVAARIQSAFPADLSLNLESAAELARAENGDNAAMAVYAKQFSPLWPSDLRSSYFSLLSQTHQLRGFLADARSRSVADPTAVEPVWRAFFYYEQQGKNDVAAQQLVELETRRATAKTSWNAADLKTLGALYLRVADYDEAAHANYSLYALSGVGDADKALALSSLIDLLLDVPEQSLQFGSRDLSIYRNVATLDRHPGFLNGILSLVLNTTQPEDQYQTASQASVAYFHRAMAERLIERMKNEFPNSPLTPPLESKLFSAYSLYGQKEAILRLTPAWLAAHKTASDYTKVALLLAETYAATGKTTQEMSIYDSLLQKLGDASGHRPLGDVSEDTPETDSDRQAKAIPARSPEYSQVLDLYISRLVQLKRLNDAIGIYRHEIDRNPDDPGIYERLALFVEQNHLDSDLELTYRAAMKRFEGTTWPEKLARFYIRHRQSDAYVALAKDLTDKLDGSDLATFIEAAPPGARFSPVVYRQVNLYAHQRFPHSLTFVRNLLASYQVKGSEDIGAYENLLRANWFYDPLLRNEFFAYLSRAGKLQAELAALPKPDQAMQDKNPAALLQYGEGKAWLANFEEAAPAFASLAALEPGDQLTTVRAISIERSLAPSVSGAFDKAIHLAEQSSRALPADSEAATLVGEIYGDREFYAKAATWWNKIPSMHPGSSDAYLTAATVFWDYYQFGDSLRIIRNARTNIGDPALFAYESGAIHESQGDVHAAIEDYLTAILAAKRFPKPKLEIHRTTNEEESDDAENVHPDDATDENVAQSRLLVLARRKQTATEIDRRTAALAEAKPFNLVAFHLRLALLENQQRLHDIHALLSDSLANISDLEQLDTVRSDADRLGFDDLSLQALQRAVALNPDPVEKLSSRLQLAKFYQSHQDLPHAESEYAALLSEHSNILGIVRANVDFYWTQKQPAKAVAILEAAANRAQPSFQIGFRREAAQKAADSADYATARRLLDLLLGDDPYNGDLLAAKAATYASQGDNRALMEFYSSQLVQLQAAKLSEGEKIQRASSLRRGYIGALTTAKQNVEALEQYQLLLNSYPEDENLTREVAHFAETNNLAERITKYYEKATADSPRNYRWPMVLARINTSLRHYPEAIAALDKAVYVRPDRLDLYLAKVDLETRLLRFDDALKTYQKIYEVSYHDSQYLVSQAALHARLNHNAEVVRLLKAAYVEPHPKDLNGYVSVMDQLANWRMYAEIHQIYQEAKPLIQPHSGSVEQLATLEAQALVVQRQPVEALQTVVTIRSASSDPKHPWSLRQLVDAVGASIDDLYTPEEKAAFAAKLETPQAIPPAIDVYHLACAGGYTEIASHRLDALAKNTPGTYWGNLNALQSTRLLNSELGRQLDAIASSVRVTTAPAINAAALAAYRRAGDNVNELRLSQMLLRIGSTVPEISRYAQLLVQQHVDLPGVVRDLSSMNPSAANQLTQELIAVLPEDQATAVVQARGVNLPKLWGHAYSALAGLFFLSPKAVPQFGATLGPRTVATQLLQKPDEALHGEGWTYYAARYGDYLTYRRDAAAADMLPATVEASPIASDSYVALGEDEFELGQFDTAIRRYDQALELSPERADVHLYLAEAENSLKHFQASVSQVKIAMQLLTKAATSDNYGTAKTALIRMNQYRVLDELRPTAEGMLAACIKRNQGYMFQTLAEGILTDAQDRKAAVEWLLRWAPDPESLANGLLLTAAEKRPFYAAGIQKNRSAVAGAAGEAAVEAQQVLLRNLISFTRYLNELGDAQEAWTVLHQAEPKAERPPELLLELSAKTGHLSETLAQYDAGTLSPPESDQLLSVAASFRKEHSAWSLQIRDWEFSRELRGENAPAASYFGMAEVRLEQKRPEQALSLLHDVTLSVGAPFQNLPAAVTLLEKSGMSKEAAEYAREWRTAEPWDPEAAWAVARTTHDIAIIESVRKSDRANYALRAEAAQSLRDLKAPVSGTTELDLLTHASISLQEASQPFFILARLRAKDYAAAIALKPSLAAPRLALADAAFAEKQTALAMAAWNSYESPGETLAWLHSSSLDRAMDPLPDRLLSVQESVAGVLTDRREYSAAISVYDQLLQASKDQGRLNRIEKLRAQVSAKERLEQLNRSRAPVISQEFAQAGTVRPKLMEGVSQ